MSVQKQERSPAATGLRGGTSSNLHVQNASPDALLQRLDRVQQSSETHWRSACPSCGGQSRKLSITFRDGKVLVHCFSCHDAEGVLAAVGLSWSDLMPPRAWPQSAEERRAARRAVREHAWSCAIEIVCVEAVIVHLVALQIAAGEPLSVEDSDRFALACSRIDAAALILSGRDTWKPDYCFKPDRLIEIKRGAVAAIRRQLEGAEHELAEVSA